MFSTPRWWCWAAAWHVGASYGSQCSVRLYMNLLGSNPWRLCSSPHLRMAPRRVWSGPSRWFWTISCDIPRSPEGASLHVFRNPPRFYYSGYSRIDALKSAPLLRRGWRDQRRRLAGHHQLDRGGELRVGAGALADGRAPVGDALDRAGRVFGEGHDVLRRDADLMDHVLLGRQPMGDRDTGAAAIAEGVDVLHRAFAVGLFAKRVGRRAGIAQRPGDDLTRAGRAAVDQYDQRHV